jgi:hypothetical protein
MVSVSKRTQIFPKSIMVKLISKYALSFLALALLIGCGAGNAPEDISAVTANANKTEVAQLQTAANDNRNSGSLPIKERVVGAYILGEMHKGGVITMVPPELKTILALSKDGSYTRIATKEGTMYRRDTGVYSVEEPDRLVLSIQNSTEKGIHNPPTKKPLSFTLSEDGNELRLKNEDGSIGVFRRTQTIQAGKR